MAMKSVLYISKTFKELKPLPRMLLNKTQPSFFFYWVYNQRILSFAFKDIMVFRFVK